VKHQFVKEQSRHHGVSALCRSLRVSRSGYYAARTRPASRRSRANAELLSRIRCIHAQSRDNYGAVKTWRALHAQGIDCGLKRVARLRQIHGIEAKRRRRFRTAYASRHSAPAAANLLNRQFSVSRPDRVWATDITFVPTREGWLYVAVVIDLYSRRVVGWAMHPRINLPLVVEALTMAITQRQPRPGLIHHSDRGQLYLATAYRELLKAHGMVQSMSRKGDCYDNAVVESFFSNLKNELTWHRSFGTRDDARRAIFDYIELFYNRDRLHETLDYVSPVRYEENRVVA
jgi:transposase InsO family protein